MKKFSKLLAICMATVMIFGSAVTVFAAPSTDTTTATTTNPTGVTATASNGVKVTVASVAQTTYTSAQNAAASLGLTGTSVAGVFDLTADLKGVPTEITISVPGISASDNVIVLHQKADGTWEKVDVTKVAAGKVTALFRSLSPVAIITYAGETAKKTDSKTNDSKTTTVDSAKSPKTGEEFPVAGMICMTALCGAAVCFKKYAK